MLEACDITVGGGVWVVCCPSDMGKTFAAEFIMHGDHGLRPERSLKIDATNMQDFPKDCATSLLKCHLAADSLSLLLCQALINGRPTKINKATSAVGQQMVCSPQPVIPFDENHPIQIREKEGGGVPDEIEVVVGSDPIPILVIDDFNTRSKKNEKFVNEILRDASKGVVVFLLTHDREWATKLVGLNGGTKIKPLSGNVDNEDYDGTMRFTGTPEWNDLPWSVDLLRELVSPFCKKHGLDKVEVVPDGSNYNPKEAMSKAKMMKRKKKATRA